MALSALWSHFGGHPKSVDLRHLACAQTGNASDRKKRAKPGPVAHNSPDLAAAIFGQKPRKRWISGIGSSICPPLLQHAIIDDIVIVREADTIAGCRELLDRHGLFVGGSTGTVYRAIQNYFCRSFTVRPRVLFLCCDRGTAYLHNVFDDAWAASRSQEEDAAITAGIHG